MQTQWWSLWGMLKEWQGGPLRLESTEQGAMVGGELGERAGGQQ